MSKKHFDSWALVQFVEDDVWFACPPSRLRQKGYDEYEAKWKGDGRWYPVVIHARGDEQAVKEAFDEATGKKTTKRRILEDGLSSRRTRRKPTIRGSPPQYIPIGESPPYMLSLEKKSEKANFKIPDMKNCSKSTLNSIESANISSENSPTSSLAGSTNDASVSSRTIESGIESMSSFTQMNMVHDSPIDGLGALSPSINISNITIFSQMDSSFMSKYGIENVSDSCVQDPPDTGLGTVTDDLGKCHLNSQVTNISQELKTLEEVNNTDSPERIILQNITNIPRIEFSETNADVQHLEDTNENISRKRNSLQNIYSFSEEEPFVDSGSEYRPSGSFSADTDGDSFKKNTQLQIGNDESLPVISTQIFDNWASPSVTSDRTLRTTYNVLVAETEEASPGNIANRTSNEENTFPNNNISQELKTSEKVNNTDSLERIIIHNITNIPRIEFSQTNAHAQDPEDTNGNLSRKRNTLQNIYSFSEEEPFVDSGSEYRPSGSFSEDTDGDSFKKKTQLQIGNDENLPVISTQIFDNWASPSVFSDSTPRTTHHVLVAETEEASPGNIANRTSNEKNMFPNNDQQTQVFKISEMNDIEGENRSSNLQYPCSIATVSNTNIRKWDKKFFCIYCKKSISKLPRHLYSHHKEEPEVVKILNTPKKSKERMKLISELQNRGTFLQNKKTIRKGEGLIVPKRRPRPGKNYSALDYMPCPSCFQLFTKSYLSVHKNKCIFTEEQSKGMRVQARSMLLLPVGPEISSKFKETILSKMVVDDVFLAVRSDWLILKFGESEFQKLSHENRYYRNISDRIRELGRLLIAASKIDPSVKRLSQLINPNKYQLIKISVKSIAGFNENNNSFESPSLALKLGISLRKCGILLKGDYMEDDDLRQLIPQIDFFLSVLEAKWTREINCHAHRTLSERKWNAPKRLPLAKDIQILHTFLKSRSDELFNKLQQSPDSTDFQELAEITLVRTLILNRRRVGEMQYMILSDYVKAKSADPESDVFQTLSSTEKELSKSLKRLVIKGKKGRGVPVLLTEDLQSNINLIVKVRDQCGVKLDNRYLFPSTRSIAGHFRAHVLLRKYASLAGCKEVESITSTRLRKHIATMTQLLNLKDHELDSLAMFMGHDIRVHREYYRLSDETIQLAKISKLLISLDKGNMNSLKGKNLDEINVEDRVEDIEESEMESDEEDSQNVSEPRRSIPQSEVPGSNFPKENSERLETEMPNISRTNKKEIKDKGRTGKKIQKSVRKPWSSEEKMITKKYFKDHLCMRILPGKKDIESFIEKNSDILIERKWNNVKDFLYNELKKIRST